MYIYVCLRKGRGVPRDIPDYLHIALNLFYIIDIISRARYVYILFCQVVRESTSLITITNDRQNSLDMDFFIDWSSHGYELGHFLGNGYAFNIYIPSKII